MKLLIAADMEGITGVVNWNHVDPAHASPTEEPQDAVAGVAKGLHGETPGPAH